jgi:hypothetical protein
VKPLYKHLSRDDDNAEDMVCPMRVELQVASSAKLSEMPAFELLVEQIVDLVEAQLAAAGYGSFAVTGLVRPMTQAELVVLLPRKRHMQAGDGWLCKTSFVARQNITADPSEVTCKLCLREMAR